MYKWISYIESFTSIFSNIVTIFVVWKAYSFLKYPELSDKELKVTLMKFALQHHRNPIKWYRNPIIFSKYYAVSNEYLRRIEIKKKVRDSR